VRVCYKGRLSRVALGRFLRCLRFLRFADSVCPQQGEEMAIIRRGVFEDLLQGRNLHLSYRDLIDRTRAFESQDKGKTEEAYEAMGGQ